MSAFKLLQPARNRVAGTLCDSERNIASARLDLLPYPVDLFPLLTSPSGTLNETGALYTPSAPSTTSDEILATSHPTSIAQCALAHWNAYLTAGRDEDKEVFMAGAYWLLVHELHLSDDASGWSIPFPSPAYYASRPWLSALTQGNALSVLMRAYQLTQADVFLQASRRAVRTFELDILDGGVNAPVGDDGVFFEEVAVYPAAHILRGYLLALFGLYDYVKLIGDSGIEALIQRSVTTFHTLIDEFDTGYWTQHDLLHKRPASWSCHALHVTLLEAFASYSGCEHCAEVATRWRGYQHHVGSRLRYLLTRCMYTVWDRVKSSLRRLIFQPVKVPDHAMSDQWRMTYLTHYKGKGAEGLEITIFGWRIASPWHFPGVWLYCLSGWSKLIRLLHRDSGYNLILPQDGVFTAAFAALGGKMAGIRVVCMDHGSVTLLNSPAFRTECIESLKVYPWYRRIFLSFGFGLYWPSMRLLARFATRNIDQFLVAGNEVEEVYRKFPGVHQSRIIRYAYMIDADRFTPPDSESRRRMRAEQGLSDEAIVITMINRLAAEKGLDFAVEGIAQALAALPSEIQVHMKVLIVGDGPLRFQLEADIRRQGLDSVCVLWGVAHPSDVVTLLGISDIFLYSGTRGTNYSMAILEAMAAGCAVIASVVPQSNAILLAEGRGIAIMPASATEIRSALVRLCSDLALCCQMGHRARAYVAHYHNPLMLQRSLLRASFFAPSIEGVESLSAQQALPGE